MRLILLTCLLLLVLGMSPARALDPERDIGDYAVRNWSMQQDGLPHNLVRAIAQDDSGRLWVATWEGIVIFNGRRFRPLPINLPEHINTRGIDALLRSADGSMLVGTLYSGVLRYHQGQWQQLGGEAGAELTVHTLTAGHDGDLWIGSHDAFYRLDAEGELHRISGGPETSHGAGAAALLDRHGGMLLGSSGGLMRWTAQGGLQAFGHDIGLPEDCRVRSLAENQDRLWIACTNGLWSWQDGELQAHLSQAVEALLVDRHGQVWAAFAAGGLMRFGTQGQTDVLDQRHGLVGRHSRSLIEGREGLLWVASTHGLYRISDGPISRIDAVKGLEDGYVRSILQDADGRVWIGHSSGLSLWHDGELRPIPLNHSGRDIKPPVLSLAPAPDGGLWAGTFVDGLLHIRLPEAGGEIEVTPVPGAPLQQVRALSPAPDGSLWVGTGDGLMRLNQGRWEKISSPELPADVFVQALLLEPDGRLLIGTGNGWVQRHPDGRFQAWNQGNGLPAWSIFDFLRDDDGSLWLASDRGLLHLHEGHYTRYGKNVGLPHEVLFRILDDQQGYFWLSGNSGLLRIAKADLKAHGGNPGQRLPLEIFDHNDGMPDPQSNGGSQPAGWRHQDGRLWFPTTQGVAIVDPQRALQLQQHPLSLRIQTAQIDGVEHSLVARQAHLDGGQRVRVRYAATNLRSAEKIRYRYRMHGMDTDWIEGGEGLEAAYTNLPPGDLHFTVQATRMPVNWNSPDPERIDEAVLYLHRPLPWWQRAHWQAVLALGALLLLWLAYHLALRRQRRIRLRMQQRINAATREVRKQRDALAEATRERELLLAQLAHQAKHDVLTELPNRRAGDEFLDQAIAQSRLDGTPLSVALLDLDHFKRINDQHGHGVGDDVLRTIAKHAQQSLGPDAFVGRHGGEEFLIGLPGLALGIAHHRMEILRREIEMLPMNYGHGPVRCTFSAGLVSWHDGDSAQSLLRRADTLLYRAKANGRNRIESSG